MHPPTKGAPTGNRLAAVKSDGYDRPPHSLASKFQLDLPRSRGGRALQAPVGEAWDPMNLRLSRSRSALIHQPAE